MTGTPERKEGLLSVIEILTETAEKFKALDREADAGLRTKTPGKYMEKLKERAKLLVDLPNRLAGSLEKLDPKLRALIDDQIPYFAAHAQEMIEKENSFGLGTLLTEMGSRVGQKNELEKLIADLKRKKK